MNISHHQPFQRDSNPYKEHLDIYIIRVYSYIASNWRKAADISYMAVLLAIPI